jgi:acyl-[acyl-carrier-protein] desaturase
MMVTAPKSTTNGDAAILEELESTVASLFERHLAASKEWFPHELIPYGRGRDPEPGVAWRESDADLHGAVIDDAVRSALVVNLLTEDNLPYYFRSIEVMFGAEGSWGEWSRRWTAEEGRHSMAIYGYLIATRAVDPVALERSRMAQVAGGQTPNPGSAAEGFVYLALQELATRIAHRNTGKLIGDPAGYGVMMRVATDENLHHLFYRDLAQAAIALDPDTMVMAIERQVSGFAMPGLGIPGFAAHAAAIARAGVYDLAIHHEQILVPIVVRHWQIDRLEGLHPDAEQARERLMARLAKSERVARRVAERRHEAESSTIG